MFAEVNGLQIAYDKTGQGYPLLLIHGYPETRLEWRKVTPALAARFTVVAMHQRGGTGSRQSLHAYGVCL